MKKITKTKSNILEKSVSINNNTNVLKWLVDCQTNSYVKGEKDLSKNLLDELEKLFGLCNKTIKLEFLSRVWVLEYNNLIFNVFTSKGKGTSIEICDYTFDDIRLGEKEVEIIEFLEELHRIINL